MRKVNLAEKLAKITKPWSPTVVAELNGQFVKTGQVRARVRVAQARG